MLVSFVPQQFSSPAERQRIEAAFPNARSRNYPITVAQMFDVVAGLIDDRDWEVRSKRARMTHSSVTKRRNRSCRNRSRSQRSC